MRRTPAGGQRWQLRPGPEPGFLAEGPYPPLIRTLLWHRGVRSLEGAHAFLFPALPAQPPALPDLALALERLGRALEQGELIALYGDFDVDGVTATALLAQGLGTLGGNTLPYIPYRFSEGYGLNEGAIAGLRRQGATLLVTADCGTSSPQEVACARRLGMDVLILDHHVPPPALPAALALVNPKVGAPHAAPLPDGDPHRELATVGVAYFLMQALYQEMGRPFAAEEYLDLVALGTVADVAPLRGSNRALVREGLKALARSPRPGLEALLEAAGLARAALGTEAIAFSLAPRLNAAGRLAHASLSLELLLAGDPAQARALAAQLDRLNQERQRLTAESLELAYRLLEAEEAQAPLIFLGHPSFHLGIVGLVAARLCEERYRPAIAYQLGEAESRASARAIPEFDIAQALRGQAALLVRYGGHRAAAGFTVQNENLPALREGLLAHAQEVLAGLELSPALEIDAEAPLAQVRGEEVRWLGAFAPWGEGCPEPTILSRGVRVAQVRPLGPGGLDMGGRQHLRLKLRDGPVTWPAVAFGLGDRPVQEGDAVDVVYSFAQDRRVGDAALGGSGDALELRVKDLRVAS